MQKLLEKLGNWLSLSGTQLVFAWIALVICFVALAWPAFQSQIYFIDDLGNSYLPFRFSFSRALSKGASPLWDPHLRTGFYVHATGAVGMFYPPNYLLYSWLPFTHAANAELLLTFVVVCSGMIALSRSLGLKMVSAVFVGVVFSFSGPVLLRTVHLNILHSIAWLPWSLWAVRNLVVAESPTLQVLFAAMIAFSTGMQSLMVHPQYIYIAGLAEFTLLALSVKQNRRLNAIWIVGLAKLYGLCIGSVQILPFLSLFASASVMRDINFMLSGSLPPLNVLQWFGPHTLYHRVFFQHHEQAAHLFGGNTHEFAIYAGAAVPVLAFGYLRKHIPASYKLLHRFAMGLFIAGGLLALGAYFYPNRLLFFVPVVSSFRCPTRCAVIMMMGLSLLAGIAIDLRAQQHARQSAMRFAAFAVLITVAITILFNSVALLSSAPTHPFLGMRIINGYSSAPVVLLSGGIVLIGAFLAWLVLSGKAWAVPFLVLFTAADLMLFGLHYLWKSPPRGLPGLVEAVSRDIPDQDDFRIAAINFRPHHNRWMFGGRLLVQGYIGVLGSELLNYSCDSALRAASCRWQLQIPNEANEWREIQDPLPYAHLVGHSVVAANVREDLRKIDLFHAALTEKPVDIQPGPGQVIEVIRDEPGKIRIRYAVQTRQLLVLSESYHAGWNVALDGHSAQLLRVNGDFMGVVIDQCENEAIWTFDPICYRVGKNISLGSSVLLLAIVGGTLFYSIVPRMLLVKKTQD